MAVKGTKKENKAVDHEIEVLRAVEFPEKNGHNNIGFDVKINGVTIYGCILIQGEKDGEEYSFPTFPQRKGKDDKYYNIVYVELSKADKEAIEKGIEALL